MAEMIATLSDACEREFGFLATRLFRVFKTEEIQGRPTNTNKQKANTHTLTNTHVLITDGLPVSSGKRKWKKTCCVPSFLLFVLVLACLVTGMVLLAIFKVDGDNQTVNAMLLAVGSVVGLALLLNCRMWWQVTDSVLNSQRKRLHSAANRMHKLKSEGFMKVRRGLTCADIR